VIAVVEPVSNVSELELKHGTELIEEQSKKPFEIVTSPVEEMPPPAVGSDVDKVSEPFMIDTIATDEVPDSEEMPDPIPADDPTARMAPSKMSRRSTLEVPLSPNPDPICTRAIRTGRRDIPIENGQVMDSRIAWPKYMAGSDTGAIRTRRRDIPIENGHVMDSRIAREPSTPGSDTSTRQTTSRLDVPATNGQVMDVCTA
jgi:hypothetical protein